LGFGTGGLLRIGSARERQNVLAAALASGITHFDTAPIYGFGEAERSVGRVLGRERSRLAVATKFGLTPSPLAARLAPLQRLGRRAIRIFPLLRRAAVSSSGALYNAPDFTPATVRGSLEKSLRALRTDHVDFFLAHQASSAALPSEAAIDLLEELRQAGKIVQFGVATEFDWLMPVLGERPRLGRVVQFDSGLTSGHAASLAGSQRLLITYGFIQRTIAVCRERLRSAPPEAARLQQENDETLGGLVLRAAVLANPGGITLMQSRSPARIERNVRAAGTALYDDRVQLLTSIFERPR
jgi:aryl-alcohol dehydrogenase-like predicted oxidoreductase